MWEKRDWFSCFNREMRSRNIILQLFFLTPTAHVFALWKKVWFCLFTDKRESERGAENQKEAVKGQRKAGNDKGRDALSSKKERGVRLFSLVCQENRAWILDRITFISHSHNPMVHLGKARSHTDIHKWESIIC